MRMCSIASGSSGNCIYIGSQHNHILIDAGISGKRVEAGLKDLEIAGKDVDAILITHEHSDHIKGLGVLARKYAIPIYSTPGTVAAIRAMDGLGKIEDDLFVEYARVLFTNYGKEVKYWLTINEQNTMILHPGAIGLPKGGKLPSKKELYQQNHHLMLAQARVMKLCHELCPEAKIGPALNLTAMYPETCKPEDVIAAHNWEVIRCWNFADVPVFGWYHPLAWRYLQDRGLDPEVKEGDRECLAGARPDFMAMNYYSTATIAASRGDASDVSARAGDQQIMLGEEGVYRAAENPYVAKTKYGWVIDPSGFRYTLRKVYERYHLPILITENGIGAPDALENGQVHDDYRIDFIRQHLNAMRLAITDGVEVIGYCPWAALDVVSTHQGYQKRYGFLYVDRDEFDLKDMRRIKKDSYFWYQKVIAGNGDSL